MKTLMILLSGMLYSCSMTTPSPREAIRGEFDSATRYFFVTYDAHYEWGITEPDKIAKIALNSPFIYDTLESIILHGGDSGVVNVHLKGIYEFKSRGEWVNFYKPIDTLTIRR